MRYHFWFGDGEKQYRSTKTFRDPWCCTFLTLNPGSEIQDGKNSDLRSRKNIRICNTASWFVCAKELALNQVCSAWVVVRALSNLQMVSSLLLSCAPVPTTENNVNTYYYSNISKTGEIKMPSLSWRVGAQNLAKSTLPGLRRNLTHWSLYTFIRNKRLSPCQLSIILWITRRRFYLFGTSLSGQQGWTTRANNASIYSLVPGPIILLCLLFAFFLAACKTLFRYPILLSMSQTE